MKTIAICTLKGGAAKTTTAHALGAYIARNGGKVLIIDADAQHNLSDAMNADTEWRTTYDVLRHDVPITGARIQIDERTDIVTASPMLAAADIWQGSKAKSDRRYMLADALKAVQREYTHCVIDCMPQMGIVTLNALYAADAVLIPAKPDMYNVTAMDQNAATFDVVRQDKPLDVLGVLITQYNGRSILHQQMANALSDKAESMGTHALATRIRNCVALSECASMAQDIYAYAPRSNGAMDYKNAFDELKGRI